MWAEFEAGEGVKTVSGRPFARGHDPRRHKLTRSERTGRPPKAWKDWLREMEPSVREKWEELFEKAGPARRVRMMEDFFDRLHGRSTHPWQPARNHPDGQSRVFIRSRDLG